ncbi:MAG: glycosyltransferase family 39 protein [Myxococcales bacterium]|nr:glycosyltransferase family 39 protein [Myxococcales bacterium]
MWARSPTAQFWTVFIFAALIRIAWVILSGFTGLYGQDGYAYLDAAERMAQGHPFSVQMVGMPDPWMIAAAPGYSLAISFFLRVFPDTFSVWWAQVISIAAGSTMAAWTVSIGRRWLSPEASIGAGVVVAMAPVAVQTSVVVMTDAFATALGIGCIWSTLRTLERPNAYWAILSGFLFGASVCTRLPMGLVAVPLGLILAFRKPFPVKYVVIAAVAAIVGMIPEFVYLNQQSDGPFSNHMISLWSPVNFWRQHFVTPDGSLDYNLPLGIYYLSMISGHKFISPVIILLAAAGAWYSRPKTTMLRVLLGWIAAFVVFCTGLTVINPRYVLPIVPAVAILSMYGFIAIRSRWNLNGLRWRRAGLLFGTAIVVTVFWGQFRALIPFVELSEVEQELAVVISQKAKADDEIVGFKTAFALEWYLRRPATELFFFDETVLGSGSKRKIVVWDPHDLAKRATTPILHRKKKWFDDHCIIEPVTKVRTIAIGYADCSSFVPSTEKIYP